MKSNWILIILLLVIAIVVINGVISMHKTSVTAEKKFQSYLQSEPADTVWRGPGIYQIPYYTDSGKLISYGYALIAHTSVYLGPKGIVAHISNGMNCQNCHLDGGMLPYALNFGKTFATYPQYKARSNTIQTIYERVNDCFERSLNGKALDTTSKEMQAIYAYIQWLDKSVPKGDVRGGTTDMKLQYMNTAASVSKGRDVFINNCVQCHGNDGQGKLNTDGNEYVYPPLWGDNSYNDGAGLYRISTFASFVKNNMPFGTDYHHPKLSDEEAWNVAAFVNSQPRPHKDQSNDWKNIFKKPIDFPFGPYADSFSETQHKYGPFLSIKNAQKQNQ